jgi:GNAT superfamily N-acetyltransferase
VSEKCQGACFGVPPFAYEVAEAGPSHMAWVFKSWLESYHQDGIDVRGSRMGGPDGGYSAAMTLRMRRLVERSRVYVAVEPDDGDHLLGFAIVEAGYVPVVHFVYVKARRRKHGLAAALLRHAFKRVCAQGDAPDEWHYSHATYNGKRIAGVHGGRHNAAAAWDEQRRAG